MMNKFKFLIIVLVFMNLFSSCKVWDQLKYYTVYLKVKELNGIKEGALIENQTKNIGSVSGIESESDSSFVIELSVTNDFQIPRNSQVRIVTDLENTSAYVNILMSHSKKNYSKDDTIISHGTVLLNKNIQLHEIKVNIDSLPEGIRSLMQ
jgi:ABC-type transporter Mla subunit MlaD